jgi:hypothetical protein
LGLINLKEPNILFFIARVLLLQGLFTRNITTEGLEIKFFIEGSWLYTTEVFVYSIIATSVVSIKNEKIQKMKP